MPREVKKRDSRRQEKCGEEDGQQPDETFTAVDGFAQGSDSGKCPFRADVREELLQGFDVFARVIRNRRDRCICSRKPEVDEFGVRAISGDEDIIGLEIMVNELETMDVFERIQDLV